MQGALVLIDFSRNTQTALNYARLLFQKSTVTFYLLHIYENPRGDYDESSLGLDTLASDHKMDALVEHLERENQYPAHSFKAISKPLPFIESVKEVVFLHDIDLIVMATKGSKVVFDIFMDADAVKLLNTIGTLPIILVPKGPALIKPAQIVFFTNFTRVFNRSELRALLFLVKLWDCSIKVIHFTAMKRMDEFQLMNKGYLTEILAGVHHSFEKINAIISKTEAINQYVGHIGSDMISLVNHKYNFLYRLTRENIVKKVAFNSELPILVLPELVKQKLVADNGVTNYGETL